MPPLRASAPTLLEKEGSMTIKRLLLVLAMVASLAFVVAACGDDETDGGSAASDGGSSEEAADLSGSIRIDGSSTVFPFAEAAGELFNEDNPNVKITVGESGTGGGFEKFCAGETDISDASRPIKPDEEAPVCKKAGVKYEEIQIANDGIAVVTNPNLKVDCLTTAELKKIWAPKSKVSSLKQVNGSLPDGKLALFGPGTDSGTFDFFTDKINGEEGVSREDYEASEDDNQLVTGVAGSDTGLGYFGFSYYESNQDKLNLVGVGESADKCVKPSAETIQDASYFLSRPLFMYPSDKALKRPEVDAFMKFVVDNYQAIAEAAKIVPMTDQQASESKTEVGKLAGS
jgi:phosphate transport system substrate-binding protein